MIPQFDQNLLSELIDQSHNPPGGDPVLGNFYGTIIEMVESNSKIADILMKVKSKRPDITYKHLVNLVFRAYQAIKFKQGDFSYRLFISFSQWHKELISLYSDNKLKANFEKLLLKQSTTTTIYQRYAGVYVIISHFWQNRPVALTDLGCGGNYGLRGIELREPFKGIYDLTPKKIVTKLLSSKLNLRNGLSLDKENPDDPKVKEWRLACSFYPNELGNLKSVEQFEERIGKSKKVRFLQADLLTTRKLPKKSMNAVILSMILYQLTLPQQILLIEKAKKLLKKNGIIIVQDYAAKSISNPHHLDFNESWFGRSFSFRTFILGKRTDGKFLEIFQWNNGRCNMVKAGQDFDLIFGRSTTAHLEQPSRTLHLD